MAGQSPAVSRPGKMEITSAVVRAAATNTMDMQPLPHGRSCSLHKHSHEHPASSPGAKLEISSAVVVPGTLNPLDFGSM